MEIERHAGAVLGGGVGWVDEDGFGVAGGGVRGEGEGGEEGGFGGEDGGGGALVGGEFVD